MILGFFIWSLITFIFIAVGISSRKSKKPAGFWANSKPLKEDEIKDVKKFNRAVSNIFFIFAAIYELLGVSLLFLEQNSALFVLIIIGTIFLVIGTMVSYVIVEGKYRKR